MAKGSAFERARVASAVHQSPLLGSMLFNLSMNNSEVQIKSPILVFAGDTKLCRKITLAQYVTT